MPHHGGVKDLKETTKLRICYDASSKANNELSLNDCLECGPNLNPDLLKIILKFRFYPIAFCADIQRAFLEVGIVEEERKFLHFLWGEEGGTNLSLDDRTVRILRMRRMPFGVKCSSFLLTSTIKLHLKKYEHLYKRTCAVLNELYVDDLITGAYSIEEAALISKEATSILSEANMNLRQWTTNSPPLLEMWNETAGLRRANYFSCAHELSVLISACRFLLNAFLLRVITMLLTCCVLRCVRSCCNV
ncbi:hypothetical protein AVEN_108023-1 [Araneus ventricosus]|uniref:Reverse transcriptase domain-containing protein n=1 Tax=Araneus ventricosus TaxID=182803 RepID=A0A4Y2AUR2_ARAVE|nr:hypothetical protein AVEN_108023-1 [Araneus ventricosus]